MDDFDPFQEAVFDTSIDPLTADERGLAILAKLDEGANMRGDDPELDASIAEHEPKLKANLQAYQTYKAERGEPLFSYEPEVKARQAAMGDRKLAEASIKLLQADEETFNSMLEESGNAKQFRIEQAFMHDKDAMKGEFQTRHLLRQAGYSDREITSGAAEPHMRERLGAGDHEATRDAFLRWGLHKTNEFDRREKIAESAIESSQRAYLQAGNLDEFEDILEAASPDISDEERTLVRRIANTQYQQMKQDFATIKPLVRKTFNTIMGEEGINSQLSVDGEAFESIEDAIEAMGEVPREDFDKLLLALSQTAKANGEDVDGFFNKLGKSLTRGSEQFFKSALRTGLNQSATEELRDIDLLIKGGKIESSGAPYSYPLELVNPEGEVVGYTSGSAFGNLGGGRFTTRGRITPEMAAEDINKGLAHPQVGRKDGVTARAITGTVGLQNAREAAQKRKNSLDYASEIYNWREAIARIEGGTWLASDWAYGILRSLPELGATATGIPGILLVASAQKERNMAEIRRRLPDANWEDYEDAAGVASMGYSLLNRMQFKTATGKLPATRKFTTEVLRRTGLEAIQESAQDLTLATTLELYDALGADIESFKLTEEVLETVKRFPRTMFAVAPLAIAGATGRKALDYMDEKYFQRVFQDADLMDTYGIDPTEQRHIQGLTVGEGLDYIREHNKHFTENITGELDVAVLGQEQFQTEGPQRLGDVPTFDTPQGTFTFELSPRERELLPDEQEAANYEQWKAEQEQSDESTEGTTPLGQVLEETYGKYLDEQLQAAIGVGGLNGNAEAVARAEAQITLREKLAQAEPTKVEAKAQSEEKFSARIIAQPDGIFSVTDGERTVKARSPEEAAEAAIQLTPETLGRRKQAAPTIKPTSPLGHSEPTKAEAKAEAKAQLEAAIQLTPEIYPEGGIGVSLNAEGAEQRTVEDRQIDSKFTDPNTLVFHSFIAPGFSPGSNFEAGEPRSRRREGLPPVPDAATGSVTSAARLRYGLQTFLHGRDVPSKTLQKTLDQGSHKARGVESQFEDLAKSLQHRVRHHVRGQPRAIRDGVFQRVQNDAYHALRGDAKALGRLPNSVANVVEKGRESIDIYSQELINSGQVSKDLASRVGQNIGSYVTREFKVFNPDSKWNYQNVVKQHQDVYQAALKEIMDGGATQVEADTAIRQMLDSSRARGFYAGTTTLGKINVSSFIKKNNDLSPAILDLLGEVVNPAINLKNTGTRVSQTVITHATQLHMAEQLREAGLASRKPNPELRHTTQIGEESHSISGLDSDGKTKVFHVNKVSSTMSGFVDLYMEPELAQELARHFEGGKGRKSSFETLFDQLAKITGVGKFMQVILNPAAYPTNFLGGVATEIFNGRVSFDAKGLRAYGKIGSFRDWGGDTNSPYGVEDQAKFYTTTGQDFLGSGGVSSLGRNQINTEMQQQGIRDNSVFAEDLNQTIERGWGERAGTATRVLSKAYQATDNAAKRSAFVHELDKWAKAEPTKTMDELVQLAAQDVRATTQNYDMVPKVLKAFSQRGVGVPTYISFSYELFRNTIGTARLASREIRSGNLVLQRAGMKRLAGMAAIGGVMYGLNQLLSEAMTGLDDEEREKLRSQLPPWLRNSEVVYLGADEGELLYFDASYLIPHQVFYNAVAAGFREGTAGEKFEATAKALINPIGGLNIFNQTVSEALTNEKRAGGPIYNEAIAEVEFLGKTRAISGHFYESMFKPGVMRTLAKVEKAEKGEVGYAGSTAHMDDVWAGLLGVRPYRFDVSSPEFLEGNLASYAFTAREIKSFTSSRKQEQRGKGEVVDDETKLTPSQAKALELVSIAEGRNLEEFTRTIKMFKTLKVSDARIKQALKAARVPKYLRAKLPAILAEIGVED